MNDDAPAVMTPSVPKGALATIFLIVFVDLLGFGLLIPLLPFYARSLNASALQVTLLFSIYSICQFIAAPLLGALSDRHGRRPVLVLSQIGSLLGYLLLGWATVHDWHNLALGLTVVYLSRIIDGLSGGNISTAQAYISDVTSAENRSRGMGMLGAAFGMGFVAGPALAGILSHFVHPAAPAFTAALLAGLAAWLSYARLPESHHRRETTSENWLHPGRFTPVLRRPVVGPLMLIWFTAMIGFVMIDSTIALYLNDLFHFGPAKVAWYFVFVGLIIAAVQGGLIGRLSRRLGDWWLSVIGPTMVAIGYLITVQTAWRPMQVLLVIGAGIYAIGRSLHQPTISALVSRYSDPRRQGITFGLFQGIGTLARVVGPLVAGLAYERHVTAPFLAGGVMVATAALWTAVLHLRTRRVPLIVKPAAQP